MHNSSYIKGLEEAAKIAEGYQTSPYEKGNARMYLATSIRDAILEAASKRRQQMSTMAEWGEAEDHITEALKSLGEARRTCPNEAKAIELLELEVQLCGIGANLPNFLAAQYELESP